MAASEGHSAETDHDMCSVQERTEELFNKLADEEGVSSEPAGLVVALTDLDLQVTEEQVVEVTREILGPTKEYFSKDAFSCFIERLRQQPSVQPDGESANPDSLESTEAETRKSSSGSNAGASCAEGGARGSWVFEPRVGLDVLDVHARVSAESVYARVDQTMVSDIDEAVDTALATFLSTLPCSLSEEARLELRQKWLMQHYVTQVAEVVERCRKASWSFKPALALEELSDEVRPRAAKLYGSVDEEVAAKIAAVVASELENIGCGFPAAIQPEIKEWFHRRWLMEHYIRVVAQALQEASGSGGPKWTFSPMVNVESLPEGERAAATTMYANDVAAAADIETTVEK